jgi:predicted ribosome quality control (RQC) complex YloA/Tae2 family protein
VKTSQQDRKKKKVLKVLKSQQKAIKDFERKKVRFKKIGDSIYQSFENIDELLSTIVQARKKNVPWEEIETKLSDAKEKGIASAQILEKISPEKGSIQLKLDSEIIEVDFRKSATEIANEFYQRAKKASRKIAPAKEALKVTEKRIEHLDEQITEKKIEDAVLLKRRKRKWFEKYHWTTSKNGYLIIGGKDISSNEEIVKRRMTARDLFFHAELHGAPYTILLRDSSDTPLTEDDYGSAALLAASFSNGWKAGYGAVDVYYVGAENVSFSAPSGEYIPKGGIMVRGDRTYIKGVELIIVIGVQIHEANATVIYGSEETIKHKSMITVTIKPGSISKGKIAKKIKQIFLEKAPSVEDKAKIKGIDLNEFVHAIPHDSVITGIGHGSLIKTIESD